MGIRENALVYLKGFYDTFFKYGAIRHDLDSWNKLEQELHDEYICALKYMVEKGWIIVDWTGPKHCPTTIELTPKGIDQIEYPNKQSPHSSVINVTNNHGVVAHEAHHFEISNDFSVDRLKELIESTLANHPDLPAARELVDEVKQPLAPGILSRFGDLLSRHSWLSSAVAQTVLQILVKGVSNPPPL